MAQVTKGDLLLGGSLGFSNSNNSFNTGGNEATNVNFYPRISFGVGKNSILGTKLGFAYSNSKVDESVAQVNGSNFSFGIFWRKLLPIKEKLGWYTDMGANYGIGKSKTVDFSGSEIINKSNGYGAYIIPGLFYSISPGFLLNVDFGGLGYNHSPFSNLQFRV